MKNFNHNISKLLQTGLGLMFAVFGLNGFLSFIPMSPPQGTAAIFMGGLAGAGYFFPLLAATEIAIGLLLISGRLVPLALTVLAPLAVNIFAYHLFLAPEGLPMAAFVVAANAYLAWAYRDAFRSVLTVNAVPSKVSQEQAEPALAR